MTKEKPNYKWYNEKFKENLMNEHNYVKPKMVKDPRNPIVKPPLDNECLNHESGMHSNDPNVVCNRNGKVERGGSY